MAPDVARSSWLSLTNGPLALNIYIGLLTPSFFILNEIAGTSPTFFRKSTPKLRCGFRPFWLVHPIIRIGVETVPVGKLMFRMKLIKLLWTTILNGPTLRLSISSRAPVSEISEILIWTSSWWLKNWHLRVPIHSTLERSLFRLSNDMVLMVIFVESPKRRNALRRQFSVLKAAYPCG